jgi:hypothetical protein
MKLCRAVIVYLISVLLLSVACAVWGSTSYQDDLGACLSKPDGSRVTLPCEEIYKVGKSGRSFAIKEMCETKPSTPRLAVISTKPLPVSPYWSCDVTGTLATCSSTDTSSGIQRVILVSPENVIIYCGRSGRPILFPPIKGLGIEWPYKRSLADLAGNFIAQALKVSAMDISYPPMPDGLGSSSSVTLVYCETIAEAKAQSDGTAVELQCRPVDSINSGFFTLGEDGSPDTLKTYYTGTLTTNHRVLRVTGIIQSEGTDKVLDVDSGPNYDPEVYIGNVNLILSGTITWAKTFADGTTLPTEIRTHSLEGKVVTQVPRSSYFYVQEPDRSNAIRVYSSEFVEVGDVVDIDGTINPIISYDSEYNEIITGERAIYATSVSVLLNKASVKPFGMNQRALKCGALNCYSPGISGGTGPNIIGQPIKIWGKITSKDTDWISYSSMVYLDDGSALMDGSTNSSTNEENVGVRVNYGDYTLNVGDYCVITGTLSTWSPDGVNFEPMVVVEGKQSIIPPTPSAPAGLTSASGNAVVYLSWNSAIGTGYNIYRSQGGSYNLLGSTLNTTYTDSTVQNGITYTYYVTVKGTTGESGASNVTTATPTTIAPTVTINQFEVNSNGLLTVSYSTTNGTGGTTPTSVQIWIDDDFIWDMPLAEGTTFKYDTTQLLNESHILELRVVAFDAAQELYSYFGVARQTFNTDNFIYNCQIPSIASTHTPITASFKEVCNWTVTFGSTGHIISGSGTSMSCSFDSSIVADRTSCLITITANTSGAGGMSAMSVYQVGGHIYTWYGNPLNTGTYAVTWVKDVVEPSLEPWWQQSAQYTISKLQSNSRYGYMPNPDFRRQMVDAADALYMRNNVLDLPLEEFPPEVYVFYGHGGGGGNYGWPEQDGIVSGRAGTSINFNWYGFIAFYDVIQPLRKFYNVGSAIGNVIHYDTGSTYPGRLHIAYLSRRFKFTQLSGCMTADSNFCLAFGTPRKRYPGNGSAFLGFVSYQYADTLDYFNTKFWNYMSQGKVVGMAAKWAAEDTLNEHSGDNHWRVDYRLYGDSRLRLW